MKLPRRVPLPWQFAKSAQEDIDAPAPQAVLLNSASFFSVRSQKPRPTWRAMLLQAAGIKHAIVQLASISLSMPSPGERLPL